MDRLTARTYDHILVYFIVAICHMSRVPYTGRNAKPHPLPARPRLHHYSFDFSSTTYDQSTIELLERILPHPVTFAI